MQEILGLQDTDLVDDAIKEQQAERVLPEATLWSLLVAAENRGRSDLAQFYYGELLHIIRTKDRERQEAEMQATTERDEILQFIKNSHRGIMKGYFKSN